MSSSSLDGSVSPEFPKKGASQSGTEDAYSVQARFMFTTARQFGEQLFDERWQTVKFSAGACGVPSGPPSFGARDKFGLYGYQAAQALRWWFHANAAANWQDGCIETRLVKHKIQYSFSEVAESAHAVVGGDDRSGLMPDYGAKR